MQCSTLFVCVGCAVIVDSTREQDPLTMSTTLATLFIDIMVLSYVTPPVPPPLPTLAVPSIATRARTNSTRASCSLVSSSSSASWFSHRYTGLRMWTAVQLPTGGM